MSLDQGAPRHLRAVGAGLLDLGRCARNALLGFCLHGPLVFGWILLLEGLALHSDFSNKLITFEVSQGNYGSRYAHEMTMKEQGLKQPVS